ncbi:MAG TPA: hypothetical protein DDY78_02905, partial [Planctomycetales bacterium]|nr:hypothetical protein [Planctomycetales bacterium]
MFSIKLPNDGSTLLLTPQWSGLPAALQVALLVAVCLVPFVLIAWLYRYEMQLVPRAAAVFLLSMRVLVLFLLLFLVCLQPVYAHSKTKELPGRVLVAVDRSDSMDVADPQRPSVEKLRLVRALHLGGDICGDDQLDAWIREYTEKGSPQWVHDDEARDDQLRRGELESSRRGQHDRVCELADKVTRTQTARRILYDDGLRLLSTLAAKHDVELIGFHSTAWNAPADRPETLFDPTEAASADKAPAPTSNAAGFTDLRLPLVRALERSGAGQGKLLGVIVLTDGRHNAGDPPVKKALELGEREVPIFPVLLGAELPPPDTAILSVKAPPAVYKDASAGVDVRFKVSGMDKQDVVLELHRGAGKEKKLIEQRTVHHDGKDREYLESFQVRMDEAGPQTLTATVHPADLSVKETSTENNSGGAVVNVAKDQARVLLIDGEARWEFHYLQSAFQRDRTMQTQSVVFDQPRLNTRLTDEDLDKIGSPRQHLPAGPDALADYDCIVLGDVSPEQLPPADRQRLDKYVAERGGTLVVVAGKRYMPLTYPEAAADGGDADPIRKMLPIEAPRVTAPLDGFTPALTADGRETKFMDLEEEAGKNDTIWAQLPHPFWGVVGQAKPAAATLAFTLEGAVDPLDPTAQERRNALIARQNYGLGRVLYVGMDSTWRWRKGVGDLYHHRFWGQVMRWAADRPLESGNQYVRFGASQPVFRGGQDVELFVRFKDVQDAAKAGTRAEANILRRGGDGKPVAVVPLNRKPAQPSTFEARVANLPEGDYEVRLEMPAVADKLLASPTPPNVQEKTPPEPIKASFT